MARGRTFAARSDRVPVWANVLTELASVTIGAAKSGGGLTGVGVSTIGSTLIRTRGRALIHFDPTTIADTFQVGIGLGLFNSDAFAVGVTALPGPISDAGFSWVYHDLVTFGPASTATESNEALTQNIQIEIDSKSMRKFRDNQTLGWVTEGNIMNGGGTFDISLSARHLFLLG